MLITASIGDYPLYIFEESDTVDFSDFDPFYYSFEATYDEHIITAGRGICDGIPCELCSIRTACKDGKLVSRALLDHITTELVELQL